MPAKPLKTVPDHWKAPVGPYRQAPPEYGGEWWQVSPFTGPEPWKTQNTGQGLPPEELPPGFLETFGPRPRAEDFRGRGYPANFQAARDAWENNLAHFKRAGWPDWATPREIQAARDLFMAWGMGEARPYEGRYGFMVRFPDSAVPDFDESAYGCLKNGHHVVAHYQIRVLQQGGEVLRRHPFVPPEI